MELTNEAAVQRALEIRWSKPGPPMQWGDVASELKRCGTYPGHFDTIRKGVARYEREGRVSHQVEGGPQGGHARRQFDLERELIHRFGIRHAIVVERGAATKTDEGDDAAINALLAPMGASVLLGVLRDGDRVGVGCGRGLRECVNAIQLRAPTSVPKVAKVLSLAGRMSTTTNPQGPNFSHEYDADNLTNQMRGLLNADDAAFVGQALAGRALRANMLSGPKGGYLAHPWKWPSPSCPHVALVGVGALAGKHRLANADEFGDLTPIQDELNDLRDLAHDIDREIAKEREAFHVVGDVASHLLVNELPPVHERLTRRISPKLRQVVERVKWFNDRVCAPTYQQLQVVASHGLVIVVGGGIQKRYTLLHVLREKLVTHFVTDHESAAWLCEQQMDGAGNGNSRCCLVQ